MSNIVLWNNWYFRSLIFSNNSCYWCGILSSILFGFQGAGKSFIEVLEPGCTLVSSDLLCWLARILIRPAEILSTKNGGWGSSRTAHRRIMDSVCCPQTLTPFSHGVNDYIWARLQTVISKSLANNGRKITRWNSSAISDKLAQLGAQNMFT